MKLYYSKGSCSDAVRITLYEIGIDCEFEAVDLKTKKTETGKDFFAINPKGAVPTFVTDQKDILTENAAIQQYLADTYQATTLLPPINNMLRYHVLEWLSYIGSDLHKTCGALFNPMISPEMKTSLFIPMLMKKWDIVDKQLSDHLFITGDTFTVADSYLYILLTWLPVFKMDINQWPHVARYFKELTQRKSIQRTLQDENH